MYYLYIDESGDAGDYLNKDGSRINGSSKYFVLGGIIVKDSNVNKFDQSYTNLIQNYFSGIKLESNFKLHYHALRNKHEPYDKLKDELRWKIPDDVFLIIQNLECNLLSVTIDLEKHCTKYKTPAEPRAYSLLLMLERFQYFLEANHDVGIAKYERFNAKMRKSAEMELKWLRSKHNFPYFSALPNIQDKIQNGNPITEPILNFADFFAYAQWIKRTTNFQSNARWESIKHKYYNLYGNWVKTGNVSI